MTWKPSQFNNLSAGTALAAALIVVVLIFGVQTSAGRFSASTSNQTNLWTASAIEVVPMGGVGAENGPNGGSAATFLNASDIYPGMMLENCFDVDVVASLSNLQVRAFASDVRSTGLQRFLNIEIWSGTKSGSGCSSFVANDEIFSGTLDQLGKQHGTFAQGLPLSTNRDGIVQLRARATLIDTNEAQGLSTSYQLVFEARP